MSRGDRSRTGGERSPEERERDRQERARRRAERSGEALPEPSAPADVPDFGPPDWIDDATELEPARDGAIPLDEAAIPPDAAFPPEAVIPPEAAIPLEAAFAPDPGPISQAGPPQAMDRTGETSPVPAAQPEATAPAAPAPRPAPEEDHQPAANPALEAAEQTPVDEPAPLAEQPPVDEQTPVGEPAPPAEQTPVVDAPPPAAEPPVADAPPPGRPLPLASALPAAEPTSAADPLPPVVREPASPRLPPPPPPLRPASGRGNGGHPQRRSPMARVGAVVALAAVIAALGLLLYSLLKSGHSSTTSTTPAVVRVLIPEGDTRLQIAEIARKAGLRGSYRAASRSSPLLDPRRYGAPSGTADLEGFLFPATYDEYPGAPAERLVSDQLAAFKERFGASMVAHARALHVTPYELLIVASMVEREAQVAGDRAKIAAVIYNRLGKGMPLGVDATLYYAIELQKGVPTYTRELTDAQLSMNSRYNTRTRVGLPPTPISNPGLASMEAAANPAHVPYLYYVLAADGCGEHVFSTSQAAFEANSAAYQAALKRGGGHPPACTKKK